MTTTHLRVRWLLTATGRWHAWPVGGRASLCGSVNTDRLRERPAKRIASAPDAEGQWCAICARRAGVARETPSATTSGWVGFIRRRLVSLHATRAMNGALVEALAVLFAAVGPPEDATAQHVFDVTWPVLVRPRTAARGADGGSRGVTCPGLKDAVDVIQGRSLQHVAACVEAWRDATGLEVRHERFNAARVLATMFAVREPKEYVRIVREQEPNVQWFAAVWHPDRLARLQRKTEFRGALSGSTEYWARTADQLTVIDD